MGRFFEGGHPLSFDALCRNNVVLQIEDFGDDADKAFFMGSVLMRLSEHLREDPRPGLSHLTVIEEAHRLLRRSEPGTAGAAAHAVEMFAAMLAEMRAYGEGLIIAEQIPSKLTPDVIKNTAVKIVHRLPAEDDRDSVGNHGTRRPSAIESAIGTVPAGRLERLEAVLEQFTDCAWAVAYFRSETGQVTTP